MKFVKEDYHDKVKKRNQAIAGICIVALCLLVYILFFHGSGKDGNMDLPADSTTTAKSNANPKQKTSVNMDIPSLFEMAKKSVVVIKTFDPQKQAVGQGTGFFIHRSGVLISNRHVFRGADGVEIQGKSRKFTVKRIVAESSEYDLVKLEIENPKRIRSLKLNHQLPEVGEKVLVVGNPMGLEFTVSDGIVSAIRELKPFGKVIQITSPISPGSSGSPVLNMQGEVIGVATFQMSAGQNLNFAIPISRVDSLKEIDTQDLAAINFEDSQMLQGAANSFDKGMILFSRKEYAGAAGFFKKAIEENPNHAEAYMHLGICHRETGAVDSIHAFKESIRINPEYAEAHYNLGVNYNRLNMPNEAIKSLRRATELRPDYDEAMMHLGIAYFLNKEYNTARNMLKRSLDLFQDAKGYFYLGYTYTKLKQHERAIQAYRRAIEMDEEMVEAYAALGASYAAVEYWTRGIEILNQAVIKDPQNPQVHYILGVLHLGNNDLESARLEKSILDKLKDGGKFRSALSDAITRYQRMKSRRRSRFGNR